MNSSDANFLEGIVPPMITPLLGKDKLDIPGLERLIEHVIAGGVHGLFFLGTTGEAPSLSYRLRREVITRVCDQVHGRLPVLVGVTDTCIEESTALAQHAASAGAQAVVASAPFYFPVGQLELLHFFRQLVRELPLPLYVYNMPQMTKTQFEPDTIRKLTDIEAIIGFKDSSGDLNYFRNLIQVAKARPDWRLFVGPEHLLVDVLRMGGHGGVNGGAQIAPALLVELHKAVMCQDDQLVAELQARLLRLGQIYNVGRHASAVIKGIKCSLALMGICKDELAAPFSPFDGPERERIRERLAELQLLPTSDEECLVT